MSGDNIVSIRNLAVEFKTEVGVTHALQGIELDIARGETTAIVGESGSGKSVTAQAMLRLIQKPGRVTSGTIDFRPRDGNAYDVQTLPEKSDALQAHRGARISMVFQEPMTALSPVHTVGNQVAEALLVHHKMPKKVAYEKAADMLERVGIDDGEVSDLADLDAPQVVLHAPGVRGPERDRMKRIFSRDALLWCGDPTGRCCPVDREVHHRKRVRGPHG